MLHMSCLLFGSDIDFIPIPTSVEGPTRGSSSLLWSGPVWGRELQFFLGGSVQIITRYYIHDFSNSGIYRKYLTWWGPAVCAGDYCLMCWCYKDERNQQDEEKEERTKTWENAGIHHLAYCLPNCWTQAEAQIITRPCSTPWVHQLAHHWPMRPRRSPQKDVRSPQKDVDCIPIVTGCKLKGVTRRYKCRIVQAQPFAYPWLTNNQQPAGAQCIQGYERMAYTKGRQCAICCCKYPTFFCLTKCPIQSDGRRQNIQVIRSHLTETSATFKNLYTFQAYFLGVPWFHVRHAFLQNICWKECKTLGPWGKKCLGSASTHTHTQLAVNVFRRCIAICSNPIFYTQSDGMFRACARYWSWKCHLFCMAHFWNLFVIWYTSGNQTSLADLPFFYAAARTNTFMMPFHPLPVGTAFCLNLTLPQSLHCRPPQRLHFGTLM